MRKKFLIVIALFMCLSLPSAMASEDGSDLADIKYEGVSYDANNPSASIVVLNGITLSPGDIYRGYEVADINAERVILKDESGVAYQLSQGAGKANVQKATDWDPLKKLAEMKLEIPKFGDDKPMPANGRPKASTTKTPSSPLGDTPMDRLLAHHPLMGKYEETKAKIDKIKADRDKRDAELDKLFERPVQTKVTETQG